MSDEQPTPFADLLAALDPKEQRFTLEYIQCVNKTLAARRVYGVKNTEQKGHQVSRRPDVAAAIGAGLREQHDRTNNDPDRVIRELMLVAYADPADLFDAKGNPLPIKKLAPEIRRAVSSVKVLSEQTTTEDVFDGKEGEAATGAKRVTTRSRVVECRLVAKTQAIELLGKRLKMFTDRLEVEVSDGRAARIAAARKRVSR